MVLIFCIEREKEKKREREREREREKKREKSLAMTDTLHVNNHIQNATGNNNKYCLYST